MKDITVKYSDATMDEIDDAITKLQEIKLNREGLFSKIEVGKKYILTEHYREVDTAINEFNVKVIATNVLHFDGSIESKPITVYKILNPVMIRYMSDDEFKANSLLKL